MTRIGTRCPACLGLPSSLTPWLACRWCGAAHHPGCWREACAACGDPDPPLRRGPWPGRPGLPVRAPRAKTSRRARGLLGAAAAALCAALLGGALIQGRSARRDALAARGLTVRAVVLERLSGRTVDHARWVYEVGGVPYERTGVAGPERPGDRIDLVYLPERPEAAVRPGELPEAPWPQAELFVGGCLLALGLAGRALGQGQSSTCTPISKTRSGGSSK